MITFRPLDDINRGALLRLRVMPQQEAFVDNVAGSLQEAEDEPGGRAIQWGVYVGDTPVGFVMISDEVEGKGYIAHYLWKLLIDADHQRRGYGTATLDYVASYFRARGVDVMWTSAGQGDGSPISFYERYGFERTGDIVFDDEVLLRLDLTAAR
ncbi:MAG: GNAT family N-acetyltransferase [Actinomycetota bacterium]